MLPSKSFDATIAIRKGRRMPMQRFDLLDEYTTICAPMRVQKGLPESSPDERDGQLMRTGYLLAAGSDWFFRAIAAFVRRIVRLPIVLGPSIRIPLKRNSLGS